MIEPGQQTEPTRFIQVDEDGYFKMDELRVSDAQAGRDWISSLEMDNRGRAWVTIEGKKILVEAFDEPFIALDIEKSDDGSWWISVPYGHKEKANLHAFSLDEWDRFHGRTERGVPFVLSRSAQARFFDTVDEYDDESITIGNERIETKAWLGDNPDVNQSEFWTNIYRTEEPRWELNAPAVALATLGPRLKLTRMRVLVPGAGTGNDAAWFAQQGHIVTALDMSEEAIARAKAKYGHLSGLTFQQADIFNLPSSMYSSFDLVFEHTLYCAISPTRRNELVKVWKRVLTENGHLMGVFFTMDKLQGPPYGGSEWEIRARLQKSFRALYWTRVRESIEKRLGHELFVYAQKVSPF